MTWIELVLVLVLVIAFAILLSVNSPISGGELFVRTDGTIIDKISIMDLNKHYMEQIDTEITKLTGHQVTSNSLLGEDKTLVNGVNAEIRRAMDYLANLKTTIQSKQPTANVTMDNTAAQRLFNAYIDSYSMLPRRCTEIARISDPIQIWLHKRGGDDVYDGGKSDSRLTKFQSEFAKLFSALQAEGKKIELAYDNLLSASKSKNLSARVYVSPWWREPQKKLAN